MESKTEYETDWYDGGYDRVLQLDGSKKKYYWAELSDAVVVVAPTGNELIFVNQYRPTVREHCLELPAGMVNSDESYTEAGRHELFEETGYRASNVELIEDSACATGVLRHRRAMVYADELSKGEYDHDGN